MHCGGKVFCRNRTKPVEVFLHEVLVNCRNIIKIKDKCTLDTDLSQFMFLKKRQQNNSLVIDKLSLIGYTFKNQQKLIIYTKKLNMQTYKKVRIIKWEL